MTSKGVYSMPGGLLTTNEVAARLSVDPQTVRRWIKLGELEVVDLAAHGARSNYRITTAELRRFLAERTRPTGEAA